MGVPNGSFEQVGSVPEGDHGYVYCAKTTTIVKYGSKIVNSKRVVRSDLDISYCSVDLVWISK